ncbi:MAG: hypothetical protein GY950_13425, partial [bacterium]|nr:hypothetical protein [bacterium]
MKVNRLFCFLSLLVIVTAFAQIVFHLHFWVLPSVFFAAGLAVTLWNRKYSLFLFLFLFPFINASPALFDTGLPFNYLAVPLFLLSGIVVAGVIRKATRTEERDAAEEYLDKDFYSYYFFLIFVLISAIFVFSRWSNITCGTIDAVGADTPVSPGGQRISFASIFPVVSLFIYFISPYIFFYVKKVNLKEKTVFSWLSYGFFVSVGIAVIQSISGRSLISDRLGKELSQFYGGFSDFNAFGFFSGVMFLWSTYEIRKKNIVGYITFAASLGGGILSGSRTMYFFILAGIINIIFSFRANPGSDARKKQQRIVIALLIIGVVLVVVFAGGTLKERLSEGFSGEKGFWEKLNAVTNGRVWMTAFSLETVRDNFVPGVGTGNFTFYLAYKNHGQEHLYDLTLNHYLLVFTENGVFAFLFFTFFMVFLFRRSTKKLLLGAILFSLLLNNFFWFPEAFLLFWIVAALNDSDKDKKEKKE